MNQKLRTWAEQISLATLEATIASHRAEAERLLKSADSLEKVLSERRHGPPYPQFDFGDEEGTDAINGASKKAARRAGSGRKKPGGKRKHAGHEEHLAGGK